MYVTAPTYVREGADGYHLTDTVNHAHHILIPEFADDFFPALREVRSVFRRQFADFANTGVHVLGVLYALKLLQHRFVPTYLSDSGHEWTKVPWQTLPASADCVAL